VIGILWGGNGLLGFNGPLNGALNAVGLSSLTRAWLAQPQTSIPAIMLIVLWASFGFNMVLFLAALGAMPTDIVEAARLDGARRWRIIRSIIVPSIRRSIEFVTVLNLIVEYDIYNQGFTFGNLGYACMISLALLTVVSLLMVVYIRLLER
jgi:ABC-type sugar transport system permease subunit